MYNTSVLADYTVKPTRVAANLFLLTQLNSKVYKPYIFLIDNHKERLDLPGYLRDSKTEARGASRCCPFEALVEGLAGHPGAPRASALEYRKFPGRSKLSLQLSIRNI